VPSRTEKRGRRDAGHCPLRVTTTCGSNASLAAVSRGLHRRSRFSLLPSLLGEGDGTPVRAYHRVLSKTGFRWTAIMYANGHCAARRKGERPLSGRQGGSPRRTNHQTRHLTFTFYVRLYLSRLVADGILLAGSERAKRANVDIASRCPFYIRLS